MNLISRRLTVPNRSMKFLIATLIVTCFITYGMVSSVTVQTSHRRAVIVTLIRSSNRSVLLTINMIHSVLRFHSSIPADPYPFLIFHDEQFTASMREYILSCVPVSHPRVSILFALVHFNTDVQPEKNSRTDKSMSYRMMCRFWSYDVFYHPVLTRGRYEYLMRMDDDSYFSDTLDKDLFRYMQANKLDYIYRSVYYEAYEPMQPVLVKYLHTPVLRQGCIYNNFFAIRLAWFYETVRVQNFLHAIIQDDLILRQYIGDGCIHQAMLEMDDATNVEQVTDVPYGHNYHVMPAYEWRWIFRHLVQFEEKLSDTCRTLTVLRYNPPELVHIQLP